MQGNCSTRQGSDPSLTFGGGNMSWRMRSTSLGQRYSVVYPWNIYACMRIYYQRETMVDMFPSAREHTCCSPPCLKKPSLLHLFHDGECKPNTTDPRLIRDGLERERANRQKFLDEVSCHRMIPVPATSLPHPSSPDHSVPSALQREEVKRSQRK